MKLFDSGAYLLRGRELLNAQELSARLGREVSPDQGQAGHHGLWHSAKA